MRIGRWSELSVDSVCHEHEVMRDFDANETSGGPQAGTSDSPPLARVMGVGRQQHETSGELGSTFDGTLVGLSQLRIP